MAVKEFLRDADKLLTRRGRKTPMPKVKLPAVKLPKMKLPALKLPKLKRK